MKYSVIIPHKNCPSLLKRCIDSIPQREGLEIIIVDDNSDTTIVSKESFPGGERKDTTIVYLPENKGAGFARNTGIEVAKGEWLLFADADDYYTHEINDLLDKYENVKDVDVVYLNAQLVYENSDKTNQFCIDRYIRRYKNHSFYSEKVLRYGVWTPWTRMVRKEMVEQHHLRYESRTTGNDVMFCLNCSKYAKSIDVFEEVVYNYYQPAKLSITANRRKQLDNLPNVVDLLFCHINFNREVGYICGNSVLSLYRHSSIESHDEYKVLLDELLKERHYNRITDGIHFILHTLAYRLHII